MNSGTPELVPFELLHLELVSQIIHKQENSSSTPESNNTSSDSTATSNLELLGYNAGYRLIERLAKDYPKFKDELDLLKFICKDFWSAVFRSDFITSVHVRADFFQKANRQSENQSPGSLCTSR